MVGTACTIWWERHMAGTVITAITTPLCNQLNSKPITLQNTYHIYGVLSITLLTEQGGCVGSQGYVSVTLSTCV